MSNLKTFVLALVILPASTYAMSNTLFSTFASCTGRLSAEMEHAWLMNDPRADDLAHRRGQFVDLLEAVVPDDQKRHALTLRIDAKLAHAALLTQATFSEDSDRAEWAIGRPLRI